MRLQWIFAWAVFGGIQALGHPRLADAQITTEASRPSAADSSEDSAALDLRLRQILRLLTDTTMSTDSLFSAEMRSQLPNAKVREVIAAHVTPYGTPTGATSLVAKPAPWAAQFRVVLDKGYAIPFTLSVEPSPPHLLNGLFIGTPLRLVATFDELTIELRNKYPRVSFLAAQLDTLGMFTPVAQINADTALAIGSGFKLYILAETIRQIDEGTLRWDDIVTLDSATRSTPSGILQKWPSGAPVTIHTLATLMISQSDNTATDLLLHRVGRANVEAMQRTAGSQHADRNIPFLSTREFFALKSAAGKSLLSLYVTSTPKVRRTLLDTLNRIAYDQLAPATPGKPYEVEAIEWFASASDLVRVAAWIHQNTADIAVQQGRAILAVNPGVQFPSVKWRYVGFKGGSEPGVLSGTFLLQRTDGMWYVISLTANDSAQPINTAELFGYVQRAAELLAQ